MRIISWIFYLILFVGALGFALSNTEPVDLRFFAGQGAWRAPLVVFLLSFLGAGVVIGLLACVPTFFRQRREIARLRKEIKVLSSSEAQADSGSRAAAVVPAQSGATTPIGI